MFHPEVVAVSTQPYSKPSPHLTWRELACKDGTQYPDEWRKNRLIHLVNVFEFIRAECGNRPIIVLSAYRTPSYNRKIGGVPNSQHIQGRALDLRPPYGMTVDKFYDTIKSFAKMLSIGGIGKYPTFVHIDTRPTINGRIAYWAG
jgi:uncharacterized protein YcbK (DUF882 family)